jgi:hypothetical protein
MCAGKNEFLEERILKLTTFFDAIAFSAMHTFQVQRAHATRPLGIMSASPQ